MTPARVVAAAATIGTALLLQATLLGPAFAHVPVSLPAVLVAAVGLCDGPATGIAFGFATGLVADLGSDHPAGVLALFWLALGLVAGVYGPRHRVMRDAGAVAVLATVATVVAGLALALVDDGAGVLSAVRTAPACLLADAVLALVVLAPVRRMLRSPRLRRLPTLPDLLGTAGLRTASRG